MTLFGAVNWSGEIRRSIFVLVVISWPARDLWWNSPEGEDTDINVMPKMASSL